ncbi:MAG: hypothetical protein ABEJ81_05190 [Haloferacaceae archaeon]
MTDLSALLTPGVLVDALLAVALAVGLLIRIQGPTLDRRVVLASLPWVAAGAALHALDGVVAYPSPLSVLVGLPWAYLLAVTLGGLVWLLLTAVLDPAVRSVRPRYFGVTGLGVLLALTTALVVHHGLAAPAFLAVWLSAPIVAAFVTYVLMFGLGVWMPDSGYFAGSAGAALVFALAIDGIGTALALAFRRVVSPLGLPLGTNVPPLSGIAHPLAVVVAIVWLRLILAVAVLGGLAALDRRRPTVAERGLELATVATGVVAANTFLVALGGGFA